MLRSRSSLTAASMPIACAARLHDDRRAAVPWGNRQSCDSSYTADDPDPRCGHRSARPVLMIRSPVLSSSPGNPEKSRAVSESPACRPCFCISSHQNVTMPAKTGRRSKGDRDAFAIRPMRPVGDRIRENAAALGITYNDYVTGILARAVGMPEYDPLESSQAQLHLDDRMTA